MKFDQWAITLPPSKDAIISSADYRTLKFVQLLVSKMINISVTELKKSPKLILSDQEQIINLVYQIVNIELTGIDTYKTIRQDLYYVHHISVDVTKEFLTIVGGVDTVVELAQQSEINNLTQYIEHCDNHKSFVFNLLYNTDYNKSAVEIYKLFLNELTKYPPDTSYVSYNLNKLLSNISL